MQGVHHCANRSAQLPYITIPVTVESMMQGAHSCSNCSAQAYWVATLMPVYRSTMQGVHHCSNCSPQTHWVATSALRTACKNCMAVPAAHHKWGLEGFLLHNGTSEGCRSLNDGKGGRNRQGGVVGLHPVGAMWPGEAGVGLRHQAVLLPPACNRLGCTART